VARKNITSPSRCVARSEPIADKILPELLSSLGLAPVDGHMVGRSRNRTEPIARLRDFGCSSHSVAQLLCGLDLLWLCPEHRVLARISSECRCAKCEREGDACESDRPAAHATWSASCFHVLIVVRPRFFASYLPAALGQKNDNSGPLYCGFPPNLLQSVQRKCSRRRLLRRAFASSLRLPPAAASFS
jgi:hypothetical protein